MDPARNFSKNRNFLELFQNQYRAYFKHADYEYEQDFLKFCLQLGPNGTKSGTNDQKFMFLTIDHYAKDGGKELFIKMHCVLITNS